MAAVLDIVIFFSLFMLINSCRESLVIAIFHMFYLLFLSIKSRGKLLIFPSFLVEQEEEIGNGGLRMNRNGGLSLGMGEKSNGESQRARGA